MKSKELVEKFYNGQCSEEEKQRIVDYFRENPGELEDYFSEEEWNHFSYDEQISSLLSGKLWDRIYRKTQKRYAVIRMLGRVAAAASVILILSLGWLLVHRDDTMQHRYAAVKTNVVDTLNTGRQQIALLLPDKSLIHLMPGSSLRYKKTWNENRRDVYLTGEATFDVVKNPLKPFTVYSGEMATTALGTKFTVTALPDADVIKVKLTEGKVVIQSADSIYKKIKHDYYLIPGDEFEWDRKLMVATVKRNVKKDKKNGTTKTEENETTIASNWYMFNNQSLAQVLDQLSTIYHVRIEYDKKDVSQINFIGRIEKTDSIKSILKDIALLNNLTITRKGNKYLVRKR